MAAYKGANQAGRVVVCRVCTTDSTLNEFHVIMSCPAMTETRRELKLDDKRLDTWIVSETQTRGLVEAFQHLLDPDLLKAQRKATVSDILATLMTEYKLKWTGLQ